MLPQAFGINLCTLEVITETFRKYAETIELETGSPNDFFAKGKKKWV